MFRIIGRGIRGGIVTVVKRFAQANSPDMGAANYKPDQPTTHLLYVDANNLYGFAMCQPMPISGFRWLEPNEIRRLEKQLKNGKYKQEKGPGYIFEADLEYPAELHGLHSDFPLAPERVCVS